MKAVKFLFFLIVAVCAFTPKDKPHAMLNLQNKILDYEYLYSNSIRFHFVANSDSEFDQMVKNKIKDEIINYIKDNGVIGGNKSENVGILQKSSEQIKEICRDVLKEFNLDYSVNLEIGEKYFGRRDYGDYVVPEGMYHSFTIYIGQGYGKNFWSMLFSSIGFIDSDDSEELDSMVGVVRANKEAIPVWVNSSSKSSKINISFKVFEIVKNLFQKDRKSTRLNSSHTTVSRMPSSA